MQLYRNDKSYPIDVLNDKKNIKVKDNSNDWKYVVGFFGIIFLIIIIFIVNIFISNNTDNNEKDKKIENVNDSVIQNTVKTDDGYKEEYIYYTAVKEKKIVIKSTGSRMYLISCKDDSLDNYEYIEIGVQLYNGLNIDDNVKIIRTIYYNNKKEKLYHEDIVEKINKF